jgi:hypothetical protein
LNYLFPERKKERKTEIKIERERKKEKMKFESNQIDHPGAEGMLRRSESESESDLIN